MNQVANLLMEKRSVYFEQAAEKLAMPTAAVEKDFWVCWTLSRLFSSERLGSKILFKGGTSLSKVFHLIRRFSEDIDIILDWNEVVTEDPHLARSNAKQAAFNQATLERSRNYIRESFLPEVQRLVEGYCSATMEDGAPDVIDIWYPSAFSNKYLRPEIRLEIGPLAQWIPHATYPIQPYMANVFPYLFRDLECRVRAIKSERTFWEKATILHAEAFRPAPTPSPVRYSRHSYDLAMMASDSTTRNAALGDLELLRSVVAFKGKFYPRAWAHYELAKPGTFRLLPPEYRRKSLAEDYQKMQVMLFGDAPMFDEVMHTLGNLEHDINEN